MAESGSVQDLLRDLNNVPSGDSKEQRRQLLAKARALVAALEAEDGEVGNANSNDDDDDALADEAWKFAMSPLAHAAALAAWQCGLLVAPWPQPFMTAAELSSALTAEPADPVLVGRLLRVLQLYSVFAEAGEDVFRHTALSAALSRSSSGGARSATFLGLAQGARGIARLPEFLDAFGYANPGDAPSLFQWANEKELGLLAPRAAAAADAPAQADAKKSRGSQLSGFHEAMALGLQAARTTAGEPALDRHFSSEAAAAAVLAQAAADGGSAAYTIVDVASGGTGGDHGCWLKALRARLPGDVAQRGRFVWEDLDYRIQDVSLAPGDGVELQAYNVFAEQQPVPGAHFYIFRHILRDWSDAACCTILESTVPVLARGTSAILLVEEVPPAVGASARTTLTDIHLMSYGGMHRTARQWEALAASAGLRVARIGPAVGNDRVIELVPEWW